MGAKISITNKYLSGRSVRMVIDIMFFLQSILRLTIVIYWLLKIDSRGKNQYSLSKKLIVRSLQFLGEPDEYRTAANV